MTTSETWSACSDPPAESCSDAGCPVHGWDRHPDGDDRCPDCGRGDCTGGRLLLARRGGTAMSLPLVAFLSARLDEDEAYARKSADRRLPGAAVPARLLREVAAARGLIATYEQAARGDRPHDRTVASVLFLQIAARAEVWSDHPDYRREWKP